MSRTILQFVASVLGLWLLVDQVRGCEDAYPELSPNVARVASVPYGVGNVAAGGGAYRATPLVLDVLAATDGAQGGRPGLVLVHGGSFESGTREDTELVQFADALAARGIVCFLIDYRLAGDGPPAPEGYSETPVRAAAHAAIVDTKAAIRFVRTHAAEYGVDPESIALMGESAGAIAAIAAAVTDDTLFRTDGTAFPLPAANNPEQRASVRALISFWGSAEETLQYFDVSDPPMLLAHGTADENPATPFSASQAIAARCEEAGIPCVLYPLAGGRHGAWEASAGGKSLAELSLEFLQARIAKQ